MQLDALKYFFDSCRFRSMTEAASLNRVSRPAVSQAIRKLEEDVGVELLHHKKRGFELSDAGQRLFDRSASVFDSIESLKTSLSQNQGVEFSGTFRIGVARVLSTYIFDKALQKIKKHHPKISPRLSLLNSESVLDQLEARELDIAVILSDEVRPGLSSKILKKGNFVLLRPNRLKFEECAYALSEKRPETEELRHSFYDKYNKHLPTYAEVPSWDTIWNWIKKGYCGGLVPDLFLTREHKATPDLTTDLKAVHPYHIRVYVRENHLNRPLLRYFIEELSRYFERA